MMRQDGRRNTGGLGRVAKAFGGGGSLRVVRVQRDDGQGAAGAGDGTTQCSYTYSIYADSADWATTAALATGLTPEKARAALGPYVAATDGSRGLAYQFGPDWVLLIAYGEVEDVGCE